jgi:YARHG domain
MRSSLVLVPVGIVAGLIGMASGSGAARANCYEIIGCSDSQYFKSTDLNQLGCQSLWEVRNWIYKARGYCFKTPKTIKAFGNAGCLYDDVAQVPLNQFEKYNVKAIKKAEAKKGC